MCRSLWQTPAAFTRINTCVPDGRGVGCSTSFKGALKSATWKLFMASLPSFLLLGELCHVCFGETNAPRGRGSALLRQRLARESRDLFLGVAGLLEQRARMLAERCDAFACRHIRPRHPERQVEN